jgi:hypothetical protein
MWKEITMLRNEQLALHAEIDILMQRMYKMTPCNKTCWLEDMKQEGLKKTQ